MGERERLSKLHHPCPQTLCPQVKQICPQVMQISNTALGMTKFQDRLRYHFLQVVPMLLREHCQGPGSVFAIVGHREEREPLRALPPCLGDVMVSVHKLLSFVATSYP